MKKLLLPLVYFLLAGITNISAQTATDFTLNDCSGASHSLFSELDGGKVIVITWVMPCSACIGVAGTAAATVQGYASSNPGRVKFYLVDDIGNTSCNSLNNWANANSINTDAAFSNAMIKMTDYGSQGMQKTVVLGGADHSIFYTLNDATPPVSVLKTAIDNALASTASVSENHNLILGISSVFPNPVVNYTNISYNLNKSSNVTIDVFNLLGEKVTGVSLGIQSSGKQEYRLSLESFKEGIYFIRLNAGESMQTVKISVIHNR